jgi:1-acyl-sn-glycerol-3-phosphate acyltransferase
MDTINFPLAKWTPPIMLGIENIPWEKERLLFVGNHTLLALDTSLLVTELYKKTGIWVRSLAEHSWFAFPGLKELIYHWGAIDGEE